MRLFRLLFFVALVVVCAWGLNFIREKKVGLSDLRTWFSEPDPIGEIPGDPLLRLGVPATQVESSEGSAAIRHTGLTKYLNDAKAVVTHTVDDSQRDVPRVIEALDRHGVKATFFISTQRGPIGELWPVLARAVLNGHEVGSHSRTHPCQFPPDMRFCIFAYTDDELAGSRDDILAHVDQPHVWSFAYPCGLCTEYDFVHRKLKHAGYLVARAYPDEENGGHLVPDLQTYDANRYLAVYTQSVQKVGGIAPEGRTDLKEINAKFDEVYAAGGIYNFLTHPQWLDYERDAFYEQHLRHISRRDDIWYVPMGPLYAYQDVSERTKVDFLGDGRFAVTHGLSPQVFPNAVTLEFTVPQDSAWVVKTRERTLAERPPGPTVGWDSEYYRRDGERLLVTVRPNTMLEFSPRER